MGCSDVSAFEHIYGQMSTTSPCVYYPLFKLTKMMVVNALIVWKKLRVICFLIKSSLLALTAAYTKFRRMIGSMIWTCATSHFPRCVLLPHRHAGRLHWGKAESIQLCDIRMGRHYRCWSAILLIIPAMCSPSFVLKSGQASTSIRSRTKCGLLYRLTERCYCLLIWQCLMAWFLSLSLCDSQRYMKCMNTVVYLVHL